MNTFLKFGELSVQQLLLILAFLLITLSAAAQNLQSHQWEDRLLVILSIDTNSSLYKEQISKLKKVYAGVEERRLVIYSITPHHYLPGIKGKKWLKSNNTYHELLTSSGDFEVILIGIPDHLCLALPDQ